jgi:pyruvate/2-oxoglutarate dehydrogenase complex dihydrolipoamide dehydrogenase (E3) component
MSGCGSRVLCCGGRKRISSLDSTAFCSSQRGDHSILGQESGFDRRWTPRCVHTEPAVAAVEWTEQEAEAQGIEYLAVCNTIHLVSDSERSFVDPEPTFLKVIVDRQKDIRVEFE